jgi:hypothetical protein
MTPATQEQPPRPHPPHTMSPASAQPQVPPTGEPPPAAGKEPEENPADEPGYGHGV